MIDYRNQFLERMVSHDVPGSLAVIEQALEAEMPPERVLLSVVSSAMAEVGRMQADREITLSEVVVIAEIGDSAITRLHGLMPKKPAPVGIVVLGTVEGDYHSLGRKVVGSCLRVAGYEVIDLGPSVPPEQFIDTAVEVNAPVIGVSALLLHTAENIKAIRYILQQRKLERWIKLAVGGAAFSMDRELHRTVGADAMAVNALGAVACVRALVGAVGR